MQQPQRRLKHLLCLRRCRGGLYLLRLQRSRLFQCCPAPSPRAVTERGRGQRRCPRSCRPLQPVPRRRGRAALHRGLLGREARALSSRGLRARAHPVQPRTSLRPPEEQRQEEEEEKGAAPPGGRSGGREAGSSESPARGGGREPPGFADGRPAARKARRADRGLGPKMAVVRGAPPL